MNSNTKIIEIEEFKSKVKKSIPENWNFLIRDENFHFENILNKIFDKYLPRKYGRWLASPKWTEIFRWTSCPLDSINAVILLMEPLQPLLTYKSIGYALGVRRSHNIEDDEKDESVPTVLKFFQILNKFSKLGVDEQRIKEVMEEGFNPEELSTKGILFLNVSLTRGLEKDEEIFNMWWKLTSKVLEKVADRSILKVPLFQFYNNPDIEKFVELNRENFILIRPTFMNTRDGNVFHVSRFEANHINEYAVEMKMVSELKYIKEKLYKAKKNYRRFNIELKVTIEQNDSNENIEDKLKEVDSEERKELNKIQNLQKEILNLDHRVTAPILLLEEWFKNKLQIKNFY
jgi:hypothetical protein